MTMKEDFIEFFGDFNTIPRRYSKRTKEILGIYLYKDICETILVCDNENESNPEIKEFNDEMIFQIELGSDISCYEEYGFLNSIKEICKTIEILNLQKQIEEDLKHIPLKKCKLLKF